MSGVITIVSWQHARRDTPNATGFLIMRWQMFPRVEIREVTWNGDDVIIHTTIGVVHHVELPRSRSGPDVRLWDSYGTHEIGACQDMAADLCCHDTDVDILWERSPLTGDRWMRFENRRFERPQPPQGDHVAAK